MTLSRHGRMPCAKRKPCLDLSGSAYGVVFLGAAAFCDSSIVSSPFPCCLDVHPNSVSLLGGAICRAAIGTPCPLTSTGHGHGMIADLSYPSSPFLSTFQVKQGRKQWPGALGQVSLHNSKKRAQLDFCSSSPEESFTFARSYYYYSSCPFL
ncbi:hypothetical protein D8B26_008419 [Coccidioides posadasii str. Silveira]|uniref:Uncharacterized protein n=1 Tax=Coccidioides posadasii (strain RMSCC 757 / Silveira) TaxID=443226 RepID=E9CZT3_COCPS|nr:hypothetical protein CPSG_03361 [Coccidioides posadasii str. Silveira]QVM08704.1 hypothetical protein D8B26_008419 [Coccidioides posadasii str. Silveira]